MNEPSPGYSAAQALRCGGRASVRSALVAARKRTLVIADAYMRALDGDGMRVAYRSTINPPLWELGHLAWFQEYWIARNRERGRGIDCDPAHARADSLLRGADALFDSSTVAHRRRWELPLPDGAAARGYLAETLAQTLDLLDQLPADAGHDGLYFFRLVALHEEMHSEAACYMARALQIELPKAAASFAAVGLPAPSPVRLPAQTFLVGCSAPGFAFDNELGAHDVSVGDIQIDSQPVTWARFLPFVREGSYEDRRWWDDAGWAWLQQSGHRRHEEQAGEPAGTAIHLGAYEAQAWCRWAGRRLPTEAEWECAALTAPGFSWGQAWEWTASVFEPYPGFVPHPYRDYSMPWFNSRIVLRGACPATAPVLRHPRYRNFFEPHRTDVFAGFRSCA
ncbi:MAG: ergothioneine biosynthesis protein EgtB [Ramlibacter sp.]|nr:ergothioneine biosynthesis protein EgtB [Ramlibacter sp.]